MSMGLVADIGGTNARFGLFAFNGESPGGFELSRQASLACADFDRLEDVIHAYLASVDRRALSFGSIAIAAPVSGDTVHMTNLQWSFSTAELKRRLGFGQLEMINDAAAGALATTCLEPGELKPIREGSRLPTGLRVNIVPGTGFGVGAIINVEGRWHPVQGEGGHIGLSAETPEEYEVLKHLAGAHGRVTPETVLSGPGMLNLYHALAEVRGTGSMELRPEELTGLAIAELDELSVAAVQMYCGLLGALAGDLALLFEARGGVFLSGRILRTLGTQLLSDGFVERFAGKGKMREVVTGIPVQLVNRDYPGLLGAAAWLKAKVDPDDERWRVVA